jgi:glucokinase
MSNEVIAVDIGGTFVRVALCDIDGRILKRDKQMTRLEKSREGILNHVKDMILGVAPSMDKLVGICIGTPGPIEASTGMLYEAWNIPELLNTRLRPYFESQFNVPIVFGNDAHLAGLGEYHYGAGRGVANMVYMTVGTGIGGCVIVENKRLLGARGLACELGEIVFADPAWHKSIEVKSLENIASGPNIAKRAIAALGAKQYSLMRNMVKGNLSSITGEIVMQAAKQGDAVANEVLRSAAFYIGLALVNLIHILNTELIVLGGGVMKAGDLVLEPIKQTVDKYAMPSMKKDVRIVFSELGDDAGLLGGVALLLEQIKQKR